MTHNYNYDLAMLQALLERNVGYIGVLGPKKKLERMLGELKEKGIELTERQLNSIYGPVGLEIGAETSEEIALSVIAEIKAVLSGRRGMPLRESKDFIHSRVEMQVENRKLH
jgi:xanthine/CO dehydrogenase XdhC/CoxF family maturation factor